MRRAFEDVLYLNVSTTLPTPKFTVCVLTSSVGRGGVVVAVGCVSFSFSKSEPAVSRISPFWSSTSSAVLVPVLFNS